MCSSDLTLNSEHFDSSTLRRWQKYFDWFLKALTYKSNKQLLLKSPPHTGRLAVLHKMYPNSKFIHIVRDPRKLYPSTMKLWNSLDEHQALQAPTDQARLQRFVIDSMVTMYEAFERDRQSIPPSQIIDIRYESLIERPVETMATIYEHLAIGNAESMQSSWSDKESQERGYQTNRLEISPELEAMILREWRVYAERYGYLDVVAPTSG